MLDGFADGISKANLTTCLEVDIVSCHLEFLDRAMYVIKLKRRTQLLKFTIKNHNVDVCPNDDWWNKNPTWHKFQLNMSN